MLGSTNRGSTQATPGGSDRYSQEVEPAPVSSGDYDFSFPGRFYTWQQARRNWMKNEGDKQYERKRDETARSNAVDDQHAQADQTALQRHFTALKNQRVSGY